jgi:hypothetical protein
VTRRILLVTGSRALADADGIVGRRAALAVRHAVARLRPGVDYVAAGDARGPDAWALDEAASCGLTWLRYRLDGTVETSGDPVRPWSGRLTAEERAARLTPRWPLVRNAAMVRSVARAVEVGYEARCLALVATWSGTAGTEHTARAAEAAGIHVERVRFEREGGER